VTILAPADALDTLRRRRRRVQVAMLDPWYNRGVGGTRDDYAAFLETLVGAAGRIADHVFLWGFPEIVCGVLPRLPAGLSLVAWLTWYFKNCPSVIRGWRSAQMACLHLARPGATLYPEHFLNDAQRELQRAGKLRYLPGPPSVVEAPLNVGFVGRREQTGHPAQKPEAVYEALLRMTTRPGDTVIDPMCGSGTTGAVCRTLGLRAILCDESDRYLALAEKRLGVTRS
jgi:site-specific DNA-methyltransferase (adenine-specific)